MSKTAKVLEARERAMASAADSLVEISQARARLDAREREAVRVLRSEGISWRSIADLSGVSYETLRRRYAGSIGKWGA